MNTDENKQLVQDIFSELSKGNHKPFLEVLSEGLQWTWMGTGQWSKTFTRKESVLNDLLKQLESMLAEPSRVTADNIVAEGDYVVVEASRQATLPDGRPYNNKYCWVCRFAGGKIQELREYMDTDLVNNIFNS